MEPPIADSDVEVRRLKSLIAGLVVRAKRVEFSGHPQEIIEFRDYAAFVGREVDSPPAPRGLLWINHAGTVESVLSRGHRPH